MLVFYCRETNWLNAVHRTNYESRIWRAEYNAFDSVWAVPGTLVNE